MKIELNGKPHACDAGGLTVERLLVSLGVTGRRVAVMVNDEIVKRARFPQTEINENDRVEVIQMVGGG